VSVETVCRSVNPSSVHSSTTADGSETSTDSAVPSAKVTPVITSPLPVRAARSIVTSMSVCLSVRCSSHILVHIGMPPFSDHSRDVAMAINFGVKLAKSHGRTSPIFVHVACGHGLVLV